MNDAQRERLIKMIREKPGIRLGIIKGEFNRGILRVAQWSMMDVCRAIKEIDAEVYEYNRVRLKDEGGRVLKCPRCGFICCKVCAPK